MMIAGMGTLSCRGLGIAAYERALEQAGRPDEAGAPAVPSYRVDFSALTDKTLLRKIRRADGLSRMAVLAAADAVEDSGIAGIAQARTGIIVATAFGAHATTFAFLDDMLNYGDAAVSPTTFSNSVHNAAASYIASALSIRGPALTVTQFQFSFPAALQLAKTWLDQGRCDYVLAGGVDQFGDVLAHVAERKLGTAPDGRIEPFAFRQPGQVPGEGAAFFLLSRGREGKAYCAVPGIAVAGGTERAEHADIVIVDANGLTPGESAYRSFLPRDARAAAYAPLVGSMMINSAFNAAAGALMLKRQKLFAVPARENPFSLRLIDRTKTAPVSGIRCIGLNCHAEQSVIELARP